jgi:hypothetical protein
MAGKRAGAQTPAFFYWLEKTARVTPESRYAGIQEGVFPLLYRGFWRKLRTFAESLDLAATADSTISRRGGRAVEGARLESVYTG